jgi:hypothetical protein
VNINLPEKWDKGSWLVFYADGSILSSDDYEHWECPKLNVIAILKWNRSSGARMIVEVDYYVWKTGEKYSIQGGEWYEATQDAYYKYLFETPKPCVLFGEYVDDEVYNGVRVMADKYRTAIHRLDLER